MSPYYRRLWACAGIFLLVMSLHRLVVGFGFWREVFVLQPLSPLSPASSSVFLSDLLLVLLVGVRFDALVVGFILFLPTGLGILPLVERVLPAGFRRITAINEKYFLPLYFGTLVLFMAGQSIIDALYWSKWKMRVNASFLDQPEVRSQIWSLLGTLSLFEFCRLVLMSGMLMGLSFWLLRWEFKRRPASLDHPPTQSSVWRVVVTFLLNFLLVALMARGTLAPKHLAIEDAEVTGNKILDSLCLNPSYTFYKDPSSLHLD